MIGKIMLLTTSGIDGYMFFDGQINEAVDNGWIPHFESFRVYEDMRNGVVTLYILVEKNDQLNSKEEVQK